MFEYKLLFLIFNFLFLMFLIEKAIPMEDIDIIPGIINRFCGIIPSIENRKPCIPYSLTKNPTVKPKAKPLKSTITGIIGNPTTIIPDNHINPVVLKLSAIDCFNIDEDLKLVLSIALKKEFRNTIIPFF